MQEAENPNLNSETSGENLSETVAGIYLSNPSPEDMEIIRREQEKILNPADLGGVELYKNLRESLADLETNEGWEAAKNAARAELSQIPPDFLETVLKQFAPFEKNLPAGHGKGHMLRDTVNLVGMLHDKKLETDKVDEVELLAGITAGVFHDIGNSIVERYEDVKRVGAHAEIGAVLFGEAAKGTVPPNITRLIQYAIAAHTHYLKPIDVELGDGTTFQKRTYNDVTGNNGREAIWFTRQSDRRDTSSFAHLIRDMIVRVKPIQDYSGESFYEKQVDEDNFKASYGLSPENIDKGLIGHEISFCRNVFKDNAYTSHDSEYFTKVLMTAGVGDFVLFLSVILPEKKNELLADIEQEDSVSAGHIKNELGHYADSIETYSNHPITEEDMATSIAKFRHICRVVEPAVDLEEHLESFEAQFPNLGSEDQERWARGLSFMSDVLYRRWRNRLAEGVSKEIHLGNIVKSKDPATRRQFEDLGLHLQEIARQIISSMDEASIRNE